MKFELKSNSISVKANLMFTLKSEWRNYGEIYKQLSSNYTTIKYIDLNTGGLH